MSTIHEIIHQHSLDIIDQSIKRKNGEVDSDMATHNTLKLVNEAEAKIRVIIVKAVGEDEVRLSEGPKRNGIDQGLRRARNKLRGEIRQRVEEL